MRVTSTLPRISVVTPSFNQARFVEATLRSVLGQGYPNLEYIVVDGGSSDGTVEVLERYRPFLSSLLIEPDNGQSDAIAKGFERATGDIQGWLNSDDELAPGTLRAVGEFFRDHADVDVLYGDVALIDAEGVLIREVPAAEFHFKTLLLDHPVVPQQGAFWRRRAYCMAGGLDRSLRFCMDFDLWVRLHQSGAHFARLRRVLGKFRLHGEAKTALLTEVHRDEHASIVCRVLGRDPTLIERAVTRRGLRIRRLALQLATTPARTARSWAIRLRKGR